MSRPVLLACALLAGCVPLGNHNGQDAAPGCPAIGCGHAYQIDFQRPGAWGAGAYRVEVSADGVVSSCEIAFPLSCDHPPRCLGNPDWLPSVVGCALEPSQQNIGGVFFASATPASVTASVSVGGRSLGMRTFMPTYRSSTPTPGCNLTCTQAPGEVMILAQ